jgi:hypothetical protein
VDFEWKHFDQQVEGLVIALGCLRLELRQAYGGAHGGQQDAGDQHKLAIDGFHQDFSLGQGAELPILKRFEPKNTASFRLIRLDDFWPIPCHFVT